MKRRDELTAPRVCTAAVAVWSLLGLAAVAAPRLVARAGGHAGLFRTGPVETMPIYDPRASNQELKFFRIDGHVVIDGDIDLGPEIEVLRISWKLAVQTAKQAVTPQKDRPEVRPIDVLNLKVDQLQPIENLATLDPNKFPINDLDKARQRVRSAANVLRPLQQILQSKNEGVRQEASRIFAGPKGEFRWPNGKIYYTFDLPQDRVSLITQAMDHWTKRTDGCITFEQRNPKLHPDYVKFISGVGCYSSCVGKKSGGGEQVISVDDGCEVQQVIHEIGHIVGLFHEQGRLDRDKFVRLIGVNMEANAAAQFSQTLFIAEDFGDFDWKSIMLYPPKAFSCNAGQTLVKLVDGNIDATTDWGLKTGENPGDGVTTTLSLGDVNAVRDMYAKPK